MNDVNKFFQEVQEFGDSVLRLASLRIDVVSKDDIDALSGDDESLYLLELSLHGQILYQKYYDNHEDLMTMAKKMVLFGVSIREKGFHSFFEEQFEEAWNNIEARMLLFED